MKTSTRRSFPFLGILKGLQSEKRDLQHFVNTAWLFAYSLLWNNQVFSASEKEESKQFIQDWMVSMQDSCNVFAVFCQRITLARQHIESLPAGSLGLPSIWFENSNREGFDVTAQWYEDLKLIRSSLPNYQKELRALAEAVLEFSEEPTQKNFHYWRNYFIDRNEPVLLNQFTVFCANYKFNVA